MCDVCWCDGVCVGVCNVCDVCWCDGVCVGDVYLCVCVMRCNKVRLCDLSVVVLFDWLVW